MWKIISGVLFSLLLIAPVYAYDFDEMPPHVQDQLSHDIEEIIENKSYYLKGEDIEEDLDPDEMIKLLEEAGDKHKSFYSQEEFDEFKSTITGSYSGVGMMVQQNDNGAVEIIRIFKNGSAVNRLKRGDIIVEVNDEKVKDVSDAVQRIVGPAGTTVWVGVKRGDDYLKYELVRMQITRQLVFEKSINDGEIVLISISSFSTDVSFEVWEALEDNVNENTKGVIIDLRNNPGGVLEEAYWTSDLFIEKGLIVRTFDGVNNTHVFNAVPGALRDDIEVVILVNGGSASASEIVASALRDHNVAILMGEKTYGKGSVQTIYTLSDGFGIRLTTQKYFTKSGYLIDGNGLAPDIQVKLKEGEKPTQLPEQWEEGFDTQIQKAIEYIRLTD